MKQTFKVKPMWLESHNKFVDGPTVDDTRDARVSSGRTEPNDDGTYNTSFILNINDEQMMHCNAKGYRSFYPKYDFIQFTSVFSEWDGNVPGQKHKKTLEDLTDELGFKNLFELVTYIASAIFVKQKGGGAEQGTIIGMSLDAMREYGVPVPENFEPDLIGGVLLWDNAINLRASS